MTPRSGAARHVAGHIAGRVLVCLCLASAVVPVAGWADAPQGPRVVVTPEAGKPPDLFAAEQDFCRSEAESTFDSEAGEGSVLRSAVVGTVLGAAAGALLSGRHHDNTGVGAVTGLIMGAASGSNQQAVTDENAQRRYDSAYEQCMVNKGNGSPRVVYRQAAPRYVPPPRTASTVPDEPPMGMPQSYPPPPPR